MNPRPGESQFDGTILYDPAHTEVTKRHIGRMEKFELPNCVGHKVQALHIAENGHDIVGWSVWGWKAPTINPQRCSGVIDRLRRLTRPPHFKVNKTFPGVEIFSTGAYEYEFEGT